MHVDVTAPGMVRVVLTGSVFLVQPDEILTLVDQAMTADPGARVTVDLGQATSLDSSGVALLLLVRRRALRGAATFHLHGARPEVRRHLHMAGLTKIFGLRAEDAAGGGPNVGGHVTVLVQILDEPFEADTIRTVRGQLSSERPRPHPGSIGSYGLWLVRRICDEVDISTGPDGTTVRLALIV
ncbi:anti-anti-sigma factor [Actinoplanes lutulentus]|uniref:STAS domain-containing protein n=1 Tax=Actinoplanes lutulentus TaxID=1287878 RepID=UPI0015EC48DB|nr:STAS domain-containing protein [Actinoplanes lutulentus]MBB2947091.1 anti-anti-sigma factor [Actinoplanes lutulentus]